MLGRVRISRILFGYRLFSNEPLFYGDELVQKQTMGSESQIQSKVHTVSVTQNCAPGKLPGVLYPEITEDDPRFSQAIRRARFPNLACKGESQRIVVLEGSRLIRDAIASHGSIVSLYFSSRNVLNQVPNIEDVHNVYYVKHETLKRWSSLKTPPGLLALFRVPTHFNQPAMAKQNTNWQPLPVVLVFDNIRDPGNMGTLLRTADSFGISMVLATKGCVDIWNEKAVRAGMSAQFRVPVHSNLDWKDVKECLIPTENATSTPWTVHIADMAPRLTELSVFNAFASSHSTEAVQSAVVDTDVEVDDWESSQDCQVTNLESSHLAYRLPLQSLSHFAVNYASAVGSRIRGGGVVGPGDNRWPQIALVLGSESFGVSPQAYHLAHLTGGARLFVPASPLTDSLNVVSAASVLLGEMQRQYLLSS